MRSVGQWRRAWDPFFELDPVWTEECTATGSGFYEGGPFTPKEIEVLSIAFDASYTHMYAPGARRHIKSALAAGATKSAVYSVILIFMFVVLMPFFALREVGRDIGDKLFEQFFVRRAKYVALQS